MHRTGPRDISNRERWACIAGFRPPKPEKIGVEEGNGVSTQRASLQREGPTKVSMRASKNASLGQIRKEFPLVQNLLTKVKNSL